MSHVIQVQKGFTLVELAIVMVIIGLLIGGILKGQELIVNAKTSASVAQLKAVGAALMTFQDKYNGAAGDLLNPAARLPNCATGPCSVPGDGNGHVNNPPAGDPTGSESVAVFSQLSAANLVSGIDPAKGMSWGGVFPSFPAGGGLITGYAVTASPAEFGSGALLVVTINAPTGLYLTEYGGTPNGGGQWPISPTQAHQIDMKLDDGDPTAGNVRAHTLGATPGFTYGPPARYIEESALGCGLFIHI